MKTLLTCGYRSIILILLFFVVILNVRLYYSPTFSEIEDVSFNQSVYEQLQFIKAQINLGQDDEMQALYPEGYIFIHALYALSWKDLIQDIPKTSRKFKEGLTEIRHSLKAILSEQAKSIYPEDLPIPNSAFYTGWSTLILGHLLKLEGEKHLYQSDMRRFHKNCEIIEDALSKTTSPYFESYTGDAWPVDTTVAVAALQLHDKLYTPRYQQTIQDWVQKVRRHLDPHTGLIPHAVDAISNESIKGARGCSQSLTLNFLYDIDPLFAHEQFEQFISLFLDKRIGLQGLREYPKGTSGSADIDSGPVIWGIGASATIVGLRTLRRFGHHDQASMIRNNLESFGFPISVDEKKRYLFGQVLMADVFIAWSNALETKHRPIQNPWWRLQFHLSSFIFILCLMYLIRPRQ